MVKHVANIPHNAGKIWFLYVKNNSIKMQLSNGQCVYIDALKSVVGGNLVVFGEVNMALYGELNAVYTIMLMYLVVSISPTTPHSGAFECILK